MLTETEQKVADQLQREDFRGRRSSGTAYKTPDGRWALAVGERDGLVAKAYILQPKDGQGWRIILNQIAEDPEKNWEEALQVGDDEDLSYLEARQVAHGFITEGVTEFLFHEGVVLNGWPTEDGKSTTSLLEYHNHRRAVTFFVKDNICYARGSYLTWNEETQDFDEQKNVIRFPESNYYVGMDYLIAETFDWLIEGIRTEVDLFDLARSVVAEMRG